MTPITALGSRYGIQGALGRSVKRAANGIAAPTDISGNVLWYDFSDSDYMFTDAGTTKVSTDGDLVYRAYDKSENGKYIQQKTDTKRPHFTLNYMNGLPVIYFEETTENLLASTQIAKLAATTVFLTLRALSIAQYSSFYFGQSTNNSYSNLQNYGYKLKAATQTSSAVLTDSNPFSVNNNYIFCLKYTGNEFAFYVNGINKTYGDTTATGEFWFQGLNSNCLFYAAEWIAYNSALSDTDRAKVETYLNNKWAIYS